MSKQKIRKFDFLTIFPDMITSYANESILGRAQKAGLIKVLAHNLRDFTSDKHRRVDDTPYGGGAGMVMKVEGFFEGLKWIKGRKGRKGQRIILTSASGKQFTQVDAVRLSKYNRVIFLCGRYEGVDARVEENLVDESFSVGPYVLTGGELPALIMMDAIVRNIPGVLGSKESLTEESYSEEGLLEYPQYTKPEVYKKWKVPEVLLSGDHKKIKEWRNKNKKNPAA
jgi:tRNA (guanine37-N1)-methyltransferase